MKKYIYLLFLFCLFLTGCSRNENELIMVTEAGFKPYEYYENGEIIGVDIDIAREIANAMGKKLVVKDINFDSLINEINSGKADFAAAGMSITPERLEEVDFSLEYVVSNQVVIVRNDSDITFETLPNKRIAAQLGSVADTYIAENYKNATPLLQKKYLSMAEDLKANKVDAIIMDNLPAIELVKENPELKILDGYLFSDRYGIAVKKGNNELLDKINEVLTDLMNQGKIDEFVINHSE